MPLPPPRGPVGRALQTWLDSPTTTTAHALAATTASLDPACDGSPRNWVVWAGPEDDHILVCTSDAIATAKDMRRDPASLSLPGPGRSSDVGQLCQPCSAAQIVQFGCCSGCQ